MNISLATSPRRQMRSPGVKMYAFIFSTRSWRNSGWHSWNIVTCKTAWTPRRDTLAFTDNCTPVYRVHTHFEIQNSRTFQGLSMTIFVLFKDLKPPEKVNTTTKENAGFHQNIKGTIGGVVFEAVDTIFTTRNIALTAKVGAHTHAFIQLLLLYFLVNLFQYRNLHFQGLSRP